MTRKLWTEEEAEFEVRSILVAEAIKFVSHAIIACTADMNSEEAIEFSDTLYRIVGMMKKVEERARKEQMQ